MEAQSNSIIVADDDENDFFFVERAFRQNRINNTLWRAPNGEEVISYLSGTGRYSDRRQFPLPFLLLLDLKMPRMGGFEVIEWVRKTPVIKRLPIVVFTSSNDSPDINKAYELGANSYLVKPIDGDSLREMVQTLNMYWTILAEKPDFEYKEYVNS